MTATLSPTRTHGTRPAIAGGGARVTPHVTPRASYIVRRVVAVALIVLAVMLMATAGSLMFGALLDVDGRPAAASDTAAVPVVRIHVAQPGDTMWSIAERYRGEIGHGRFVDALIDVNGGTSIQVGQAIRLP